MATPQSRRGIPRAKAKEWPVPKVATASTPASPATASAAGKPGEDRFIVEGPGTKVPAPPPQPGTKPAATAGRSEEHTSELQSLMRISYAVFCLKKKTHDNITQTKCKSDHIEHTQTVET